MRYELADRAWFAALARLVPCRHELLDRMLIWNRCHLVYALREFEHSCNQHRPRRTLRGAAPLHPLPDRLGGTLHEHQNAA